MLFIAELVEVRMDCLAKRYLTLDSQFSGFPSAHAHLRCNLALASNWLAQAFLNVSPGFKNIFIAKPQIANAISATAKSNSCIPL